MCNDEAVEAAWSWHMSIEHSNVSVECQILQKIYLRERTELVTCHNDLLKQATELARTVKVFDYHIYF